MEKSSFFDAEIVNGEYDRVYLSEDYAKYFSSFIGNGIFPNPSNNLKVIAEGGSMKVVVKVGKAWINGYYYENDSDLTLIIDNADGVLNRIDRIVLRLDLVEREISIKVKKGEYSSNSIPREIERNVDVYELAIADIKINNGALSINNSDITDLRLNTELCGLVHGTVEQIDTTDIFNTYQQYLDEKLNSNEFDEWFNKLKNKLNPYEDVALQLQLQISELNEKMEDSLKTDGSLQENLNADMLDGKHASGDLLTNEKENLVDAINEVFQSASDGKSKVANAITGKGVSASNNDRFDILANKISQIATDTTATTNDVLIGKTVYINGNKANGSMRNVNSDIQGSSNSDAFTNNAIRGVASNSYVGAFDLNVSGYVSNPRIHIANLLAQNIVEGIKIGGQNGFITGTAKPSRTVSGEATTGTSSNPAIVLGFRPKVVFTYVKYSSSSKPYEKFWFDAENIMWGYLNMYSSSTSYQVNSGNCGLGNSSHITFMDTGFIINDTSSNYSKVKYWVIG